MIHMFLRATSPLLPQLAAIRGRQVKAFHWSPVQNVLPSPLAAMTGPSDAGKTSNIEVDQDHTLITRLMICEYTYSQCVQCSFSR
jgi:hypothetical protein